MPAALYVPVKALFIRVGPITTKWHRPFRQALSAELLGEVALIGGIDKRIEPEDFRDVVWEIADAGYKPAMWRERMGPDVPYQLLPIPPRRFLR